MVMEARPMSAAVALLAAGKGESDETARQAVRGVEEDALHPLQTGALPLAAGERVHRLLRQRHHRRLRHRGGNQIAVFPAGPLQPALPRETPQHHQFLHEKIRRFRQTLRQIGDAPRPRLRRHGVDGLPVEQHTAAAGCQFAAQEMDEAGFAGAVVADIANALNSSYKSSPNAA